MATRKAPTAPEPAPPAPTPDAPPPRRRGRPRKDAIPPPPDPDLPPAAKAAPRRRGPRVPVPDRDDVIIRLYLAGLSQDEIGKKVGLSRNRISVILKEQLDTISKDQLFASENRMTIFLARQEQLLRAAFEHVAQGELRAIEVARRLLAQQADIDGIGDDLIAGLAPPPMSDNELTPPDTDDELAKFRSRKGSNSA